MARAYRCLQWEVTESSTSDSVRVRRNRGGHGAVIDAIVPPAPCASEPSITQGDLAGLATVAIDTSGLVSKYRAAQIYSTAADADSMALLVHVRVCQKAGGHTPLDPEVLARKTATTPLLKVCEQHAQQISAVRSHSPMRAPSVYRNFKIAFKCEAPSA